MDIVEDENLLPSDKIDSIKFIYKIPDELYEEIVNMQMVKEVFFERSKGCNWLLTHDTTYVITVIPYKIPNEYIDLFMTINNNPPERVFNQFLLHPKLNKFIFPSEFWNYKSYEMLYCESSIMIRYEYRLDITEYTIGPIFPSRRVRDII